MENPTEGSSNRHDEQDKRWKASLLGVGSVHAARHGEVESS